MRMPWKSSGRCDEMIPIRGRPGTNGWFSPLTIMDGRYVRFGMQLNF